MSGFSISQSHANYKELFSENHIDHLNFSGDPKPQSIEFKDDEDEPADDTNDVCKNHQVLLSGIVNNSIKRINPIYNGAFNKVQQAKNYFK